ncbi:MAG: sigma-54-dependent Fis family transcriptional regulator [Acidobacteriaceae bacterium]|nr:sigma-54-dependent Fis family transcriptional regulator [Acidobacteriaceae bacterium]
MPEAKHVRALLAVQDGKARSALRAYLRARGDVSEMRPGADILQTVRTQKPDVILLEIEPGGRVMLSLRSESCRIPIVAIAPPQADLAFEAARLGAAVLLTLPIDQDEVVSRLSVLLDSLARDHTDSARNGMGGGFNASSAGQDLPGLFSSSPRMTEIRDTIEKVATTNATVLIRGESGVGKEIAARMIFSLSHRSGKPFVKVNCAAIPHDLLESELFGYEAGAFTGAQRRKPGKFEVANGGTLFLDEIGEMHPALQAKLLHVLQDGEFARLGAKADTAVDVRVLCATNKLLEQRVSEGAFREDLFYRINVVTVHIPPLRERRNEIPVFIRHFIDKYSAVYGRKVAPLSEEAVAALVRYSWPGNIRELENQCKRYVIVGDATQIVRELSLHTMDRAVEMVEGETAIADGAELPAISEPSLLDIGRQAAWQAERQAIQQMLVSTRWNRREAARRLRVSYKALLNKIKQLEVETSFQNGDSSSI